VQLGRLADALRKSTYGDYLIRLLAQEQA